tara:strand:+ start:169 stop:2427 length:2259 start_codon:yes stop_codon:yes gene_type:complete
MHVIEIFFISAFILCVSQAVAFAQTDDPIELEDISIIGTKTERLTDEIPASITVIKEDRLDKEIVRDISDLVRYEPGISLSGTGSRFGLSGFNIRGIEGDRVQILIDGIRTPDEFASGGPFLDSRRDYVDIDLIESVEILKGAGSSLYGSDAIGGVVSFNTRRPSSYVTDNEPLYFSYKSGYSSKNNGLTNTAHFGFGGHGIATLVTYTNKSSDETKTAGLSGFTGRLRQEADPATIKLENISIRTDYDLSNDQNIRFLFEDYNNHSEFNVLSEIGNVVRGTVINGLIGDDVRDRQRVSLEYRLDRSNETLIDGLLIRLYSQSSENTQKAVRSEIGRSGPQINNRTSIFRQKISGFYLQTDSEVISNWGDHYITAGFDFFTKETSSLRNANLSGVGGNPLPQFFTYPTRDFPNTDVKQFAFFFQDEIRFFNDSLLLLPGIRFDNYDADVVLDSIYRTGNAAQSPPEDYSDSQLTKSFGINYKLDDEYSVFARYGEGFRAPSFDAVNQAFTNVRSGYKSVSNSNLRSEKSEGFEFGFRLASDNTRLKLALFNTIYRDFIKEAQIAPEFLRFGGVDPADGLLTFKSVNIPSVRIYGAELGGETGLSVFNTKDSMNNLNFLDNMRFRYSISYARGESRSSNEPLDEIQPLNGVFGLSYENPNKKWGTSLNVVFAAEKEQREISSSTRRSTDGYTFVDLLGYAALNEKISLSFGLFNIFDKQYLRWADTVFIQEGSAFQRYTQPGFHGGINLKYKM